MTPILSFEVSEEDQQVLKDIASNKSPGAQDPVNEDYSKVIVKKPWGYEYLAFDNQQTAIWVLHIARKRKTSMHCHPQKTTGLVVLSGKVTCRNLTTDHPLEQLNAVTIDKGCFHSTEVTSSDSFFPPSEDGAWILEIESPSNKTDLVRANDEYGRRGKSYEDGKNLVEYGHQWLKLKIPDKPGTDSQTLLGCLFTVHVGGLELTSIHNIQEAVISAIEYRGQEAQGELQLGRIYSVASLLGTLDRDLYNQYVFLSIEKDPRLEKVSDYLADFLVDAGVRNIFSVPGGDAMHLIDSVGHNERLEYVGVHHEQAAALAADGYGRISGNLGVALVSTGPGVTNALTGVASAWVDSTPTLFISGQVTNSTVGAETGLRQYGIQESNIAALVSPITKHHARVVDPAMIRYELEKAVYIAKSGRPGPVWLEIPLDVQSQSVNVSELQPYVQQLQSISHKQRSLITQIEVCLQMLGKATRPVIICGNGIRLAKAEEHFAELVELLGVPVVSSWSSSDLLTSENPLYVGRCGITGDRAANFSVQNTDFLLVVGCRLSLPQVGYNYESFAREAKVVMVDIDPLEITKPSLHVDVGIVSDAKTFIMSLCSAYKATGASLNNQGWVARCQNWKSKYPVILPEYKDNPEGINSYHFIELLSGILDCKAVIVTDVGTSLISTMQAFRVKPGQRLMAACGHAAMGSGLPESIGACFANESRRTICICGEGGLQINIQELQTLVHHQLPITIFVINNGGYLSTKRTQQNHFGRYVGCEPSSGISFPDTLKLAEAYGIKSIRLSSQEGLLENLKEVLSFDGPFICELMMPEDQPLIPRSASLKKPDGTVVSRPIEDLFPLLPRQEFYDNMIVEPAEVLRTKPESER